MSTQRSRDAAARESARAGNTILEQEMSNASPLPSLSAQQGGNWSEGFANANTPTPSQIAYQEYNGNLETAYASQNPQLALDSWDNARRADQAMGSYVLENAQSTGSNNSGISAPAGVSDLPNGANSVGQGGSTDGGGAGSGGNSSVLTDALADPSSNVSVVNKYDSGSGRLTDITSADYAKDDERLGYISLVAPSGAFTDIGKYADTNSSTLASLLKELQGKYTKFIFSAVQLQRDEQYTLVPTFGDAYSVVFTGKRPSVLGVSGHLVFDYDTSMLSWYTAFLTAYEYYLRGSRLAKWKAKVKLVFPNFVTYTGYIMSLNDSVQADTDNVIGVNFSFLISEQNFYMPKTSTKSATTVPGSNASKDVTIANKDNPALSETHLNDAGNATVPGVPTDRVFGPGITTTGTVLDKGIISDNFGANINTQIASTVRSAAMSQIGGLVNKATQVFAQASADGTLKSLTGNAIQGITAGANTAIGGLPTVFSSVLTANKGETVNPATIQTAIAGLNANASIGQLNNIVSTSGFGGGALADTIQKAVSRSSVSLGGVGALIPEITNKITGAFKINPYGTRGQNPYIQM